MQYVSGLTTEIQKELTSEEKRQKEHEKWKEKIDDGSMTALSEKAAQLLAAIPENNNDDGNEPEEPVDAPGDAGGSEDVGDDSPGVETQTEGSQTAGDYEDEGETAGDSDEQASEDAGDDDPLKEAKELIVKAKARIDSDIPVSLLAHARERRNHVKESLKQLKGLQKEIENEVMNQRQTSEGALGKTEKLRFEFEAAEVALKSCILHSVPRYQKALALLESINKSKILSEAEKDRIHDAGLVIAGKIAAAKEKELDEARAAIRKQLIEIEKADAKARIKDFTKAPDTTQEVKNLLAKLDDEGDYNEGLQKDLNRWRASVPSHIWSNFLCYEEAVKILNDIKTAEPQALYAAMEDFQDKLVKALAIEEKALQGGNYAESLIQDLGERLKFVQEKQPLQLLSVLYTDNWK
jgi:hypothetical protein